MTFEEGDVVKSKKTGAVGELRDINPRPLAEIDLEDEYWAEIDNDGWGPSEELDGPDDIELVRKWNDIKMPTMNEFVDYVSSALHSGFSDITVQETSIDDRTIEVMGTSATGKRFIATVVVAALEEEW